MPVELMPQPSISIDETETLVDALKLGMGLCQVPDNLVQDELARGEVTEILPNNRPPAMPIHLVYPSGRLLPARVRVAIEALDALRKHATKKVALT
jgi:DNA-binding transcriptional LysR family regulator